MLPINPLPIPSNTDIKTPAYTAEQPRKQNPMIRMISPEELPIPPGEEPKHPHLSPAEQVLHRACMPRVQIPSHIQHGLGLGERPDHLAREHGARGVGDGYTVSEERVEFRGAGLAVSVLREELLAAELGPFLGVVGLVEEDVPAVVGVGVAEG